MCVQCLGIQTTACRTALRGLLSRGCVNMCARDAVDCHIVFLDKSGIMRKRRRCWTLGVLAAGGAGTAGRVHIRLLERCLVPALGVVCTCVSADGYDATQHQIAAFFVPQCADERPTRRCSIVPLSFTVMAEQPKVLPGACYFRAAVDYDTF
jgi:hypothetical protein